MPAKIKLSSIVEYGFSPKPARRHQFERVGETHETITPTSQPGGRHRKSHRGRKIPKHKPGRGRR